MNLDAQTISTAITALTPILVPALVSQVKGGLSKAPGWAIPVVAIALGGIADVINLFTTGHSVGAHWGLVLGAAGVGVREIVDQLRNGSTPPAAKP